MFLLVVFVVFLASQSFAKPQENVPQGNVQQPNVQQGNVPQEVSTTIPIISHTEVIGTDGNFNYSYETGNGIHYEQSGYTKIVPTLGSRSGAADENEQGIVQVFSGSYSYVAPDGTQISLSYVADENGFQPVGAHIPTPPPIPEAIQRVLNTLPQTSQEQQNQPISQQQGANSLPVNQGQFVNSQPTNQEQFVNNPPATIQQ